ncbi:MAG TPA: patatin-like phospholipase family protein, partial [Polyangia bacterium]|nr:patatin-like phospholipase family protein [Polyangia bacterium]
VLAGGAARGSYEVGVVDYIVNDVARQLGREVPLDILCGTSVGAINACALAAFADEPRGRARRLVEKWTNLRIADLVRVDLMRVFGLVRNLFRATPPTSIAEPGGARRGGLVDPSGIERLIVDSIPFERIGEHLRSGLLSAVTVSATHVGSGRTVVFVARDGELPRWTGDPTVSGRLTELRADHALASAAIPLLFPAVRIDGHFYCDGGLRQNVPLSPARRLGADGLIVVNPRYLPSDPVTVDENEQAFPSPLFLLGKTLNALLLDRLESDIDRVNRINAILNAGTRRYGPHFVDEVNREMGKPPGQGLKPLKTVLIRASSDIGRLSAELVRSPAFARRAPGMIGRVMRQLAEGEPRREADLLSYLLFDGEFCAQLIDLGRSDARARHAELCAFFEELKA